eukprot:3338698-Prymnesium_polylepis.1
MICAAISPLAEPGSLNKLPAPTPGSFSGAGAPASRACAQVGQHLHPAWWRLQLPLMGASTPSGGVFKPPLVAASNPLRTSGRRSFYPLW